MKHRFGLRARFISFIVVLLTTIFAVIAIILIKTDASSLRQELFSRSKAFAALATKPIGDTYTTYQASGTVLITQQIVNFTQLDSTIANVSVVNISGKTEYQLQPGAEPVTAAQASSFQPLYIYDNSHSIERILYPFIENDGRHQYAVVYDISNADVNAAVHKLETSIVVYSLLGLILSAIVSYELIKRLFLMPMKQLRDQAIIISAGHYSEQIILDRNDEIGDLALSVSQMADGLKNDILKLKEVDKVKSEFMMIASHNLRTPLTIIDGNVDLAKSQSLTKEMEDIIDNIKVNSQQLKIFAEDLLIISSLEAGQKIFTMQNISVDDLLTLIAKDFTLMAEHKQIEFKANLPATGAQIQGSSVHLRNAIYNLLDNALKFTPEKGKITLTLTNAENSVQIRIADNGAGIAPDEIDKLFTKFHRGTSTLEYNYEGSGIGLYLTKLIIGEHRGTIQVASELGKGSTFTVTLPTLSSNMS